MCGTLESRFASLAACTMDDFGSIWERDYGLGKAARKNRSSARMGEFRKSEQSARGRAGARIGDGFATSYSVYDEIFASSVSTIPLFEDVFSSSRIKVSELRENDIFRGIPAFRRPSSKVSYEDVFRDSPDHSSSLFVFADVLGSRAATSSSRASSSERQSPSTQFGAAKRESTESSKTVDSPRAPETMNGTPNSAQKMPSLGSFLAMSKRQETEADAVSSPLNSQKKSGFETQSGEHDSRNNLTSTAEENSHAAKDWVTIGDVNIITKFTENPPPARSAPEALVPPSLETTTKQASGPPPVRLPPPVFKRNPTVDAKHISHARAHSLEQVLRNRSMQAEESVTEKVLAWQRQSLVQQELSREPHRVMSLDRLREERAAIDRIAAEVEKEAADLVRLGTETRRVCKVERRTQEKESVLQVEKANTNSDKEAEAAGSSSQEKEAAEQPQMQMEKETDRLSEKQEVQEEQAKNLKVEKAKDEEASNDVTPGNASIPTESEARPLTGGAGETETGEQTEVMSEDSSIGIDTISSSGTAENAERPPATAGAAAEKVEAAAEKVETAPETPERLEKGSHKKSDKSSSSEDAIENAWKEEARKAAADDERAKIEARQKQNIERSLVARITAEVRERAALEAKAKAEKATREAFAKAKAAERRTRPRMKEEVVAERESSVGASSSRVSLREQLAKERDLRSKEGPDVEAQRLRERTLVERITSEVRERAGKAPAGIRLEEEQEKPIRERVDMEQKQMNEKLEKERIEKAREAEQERLRKERERMEREQEREREIEREKDRIGLEKKVAEEKARQERERKLAEEKEKAEAEALAKEQAERARMERAAVERATMEARARAERAAYDKANADAAKSNRSSSVPRHSVSMPTMGTSQPSEGASIRRTTSNSNLDAQQPTQPPRDFQVKGETPERRKARLERHQRTMDRAAKALAQKNQRDLELQSEQAERQRLAERLDSDIKRWSLGKDGNIRALLSTLHYVLWPDSGWKQVSLTELISSASVKKAYRRAALCVHPDKMQQKHASVQQKYIAEKVFHILQVAWNKFNSQETL